MPTVYIFGFDADIASVFCDWLQSHGFEVKGFTMIEDLLEQLSISHPDCIILDCHYNKFCITSNLCNTIHFIPKPVDLWEVLKVVNSLLCAG